ncbi:hypothetical protein EKD16_12995 [Streptomonospora litoralis]|uniref:Uncharacterized protein n=2 Tax=Streptomonospora litoralis TaxID=2498135 RepID=A0A4P6Q4V8_9ACTN|nr:hypothetical protein EKD16_12995 [Streptomonospora litoralis]
MYVGGCGGELSDKVYKDRVCHLAHQSSSNGCTRRHGAADSADHLYASKNVNRWLEKQGWDGRYAQYTGEFSTGGTCTRVLLETLDALPPICIELSERFDSYLTQLLQADEINRVDWLIRDNSRLAGELIDRNGYALRIRFKDQDLGRAFEVGTATRDGHLRWSDLSECVFTLKGIRTPTLADGHRLRLASTAARTPRPEFEPETVDDVEKLRRLIGRALKENNPGAARHAIDTIVQHMSGFPPEAKNEFRAKLIDLQKLKDRSAVRLQAERLLHELDTAVHSGEREHAAQLKHKLHGLARNTENGLSPQQRRMISSRLGAADRSAAARPRASAPSVGQLVTEAVEKLEAAVRKGDRRRVERLRKDATAMVQTLGSRATTAQVSMLRKAITQAQRYLRASASSSRKPKR